MLSRTQNGNIVYRASHPACRRFPRSGEQTLLAGVPRNYAVYDPLDFVAEVTQHIPNKGEHQIRYYGWYSNKSRGMRQEAQVRALPNAPEQPDTPQRRASRMTWAALITAQESPLGNSATGAGLHAQGNAVTTWSTRSTRSSAPAAAAR
jgi:hypothetical protein